MAGRREVLTAVSFSQFWDRKIIFLLFASFSVIPVGMKSENFFRIVRKKRSLTWIRTRYNRVDGTLQVKSDALLAVPRLHWLSVA